VSIADGPAQVVGIGQLTAMGFTKQFVMSITNEFAQNNTVWFFVFLGCR